MSCPFAHPLCIFLANSLVKTSFSGASGILHYFSSLFFSGLKKPCVRTFPDARLLIFFLYVFCVFFFDVFLWCSVWIGFSDFLQRGFIKKCQRGSAKMKKINSKITPILLFYLFLFVSFFLRKEMSNAWKYYITSLV